MSHLKKIYLGVILVFVSIFAVFTFWNPFQDNISVWQSFTSAEETSFAVLVSQNENPSYKVIDSSGNLKNIQVVGEYYQEYSNWGTQHLQVKELSPDETYELIVEQNKSKFKRKFKTLKLNKDSLTIAIASCMDDRWSQKIQDRIWKDLLSHQPDMVFLIGDNVYADKYVSKKPSMPDFHKRFVETIQTLHLYKTQKLVPILAIWDDHDYGFNNGHKNFVHKENMQKLFRGFFPLYANEKNIIKGPGISFLLKTDHQNFFFMDDRSFRDESSSGMLWGKTQEDWLIAYMMRLGQPSWIINGGQFLGRHHPYESFEREFPQNFKSFFNKLSNIHSPAFFVSGDRHLTELLFFEKILPYETYELTTSGIHAVVYPPDREISDDSRVVNHVSGKHNYAIVKSQVENESLNLDIQVFGEKKSILYSNKLKIQKK